MDPIQLVEEGAMTLCYLDHVNIRTARIEVLSAFYRDVLGLSLGPRPPFAVNGAWLYCGERAAVHLVEVAETPDTTTPRFEHFAFRADDIESFLAHLATLAIPCEITDVPGWEIRQVNLHDPDGNHIEIAFAMTDAEQA
jgi:catechol 2,3-dioxygenase-like lactoylglutathione lyase family enzyme